MSKLKKWETKCEWKEAITWKRQTMNQKMNSLLKIQYKCMWTHEFWRGNYWISIAKLHQKDCGDCTVIDYDTYASPGRTKITFMHVVVRTCTTMVLTPVSGWGWKALWPLPGQVGSWLQLRPEFRLNPLSESSGIPTIPIANALTQPGWFLAPALPGVYPPMHSFVKVLHAMPPTSTV